jgi:hypothetical protein
MGQIHAILESLDRSSPSISSLNRRTAPRMPVRMGIPATILGDTNVTPLRIYTRNISRSGVAFLSRRSFKPGERLALTFHLPGQSPKLVLAQVTFTRYVRQALYESGARFLDAVPDTPGPDRIPSHWWTHP